MTEPLTPEQFDEAMDAVLCGECDNQAHVQAARLIESSHELLRARLAEAERERDAAEAKFVAWSGTDVPALNLALSRCRDALAALRAQQDGGDR